jgi:hypothetical protein
VWGKGEEIILEALGLKLEFLPKICSISDFSDFMGKEFDFGNSEPRNGFSTRNCVGVARVIIFGTV